MLAVIACGALGAQVRLAARALNKRVEIHSLPALLHNRPAEIAPAVEKLCARLRHEGKDVAVAYADCGTYGALDEVCRRLGIERLPGLHCYDATAGSRLVAELLAEEPGTYFLTDFLVKTFDRLVARELGLDRHPELVGEYFAHYRRVVWLAERPSEALEARARAISARLGLDLEIRCVGSRPLARALDRLLSGSAA
jgi:hypothetical protein